MRTDYTPQSLLESGLYAVGLHPLEEPEGTLLPFYVKLNLALQLTAGAASYARHRDITWAVVHGLMGPIYLAYVGAQVLSLEEARGLQHLFRH